MTTFEDVRSALQCGRPRCACARGRNVHCPVKSAHKHGDNSPSLTLDYLNGKVLWNCKTGCTNAAVKEALLGLGLWSRTQTAAPPGNPAQRAPVRSGGPVAVYRYVTADGELVGEKGRFEPKTFRWRLPESKEWSGLEGASMSSMPLYNLPALLQNPAATVWMVEGEKAVEACRAQGLVAVCLAGGASQQMFGNALDPLMERDVVLWPDNDEPGRALMARIANILPSVRYVKPAVPDHGDAHDYFEGGGTVEALARLMKEPEPVVRVSAHDAVTIDCPLPGGSVTFEFSQLSGGNRNVNAWTTVKVRMPGHSRDPFSRHVNLGSTNNLNDLTRTLREVYPGDEFAKWTRLLNDAANKAVDAYLNADASVDVTQGVPDFNNLYLVDGFIPQGVVTTLFAMGGTGKSYLSTDCIIACILGIPWLGMETRRVQAAGFLDYEANEATIMRRYHRLARANGLELPAGSFRYIPGRGIPVIAQRDYLTRLVEQWGLEFMVVDSAVSAAGGKMKDADGASEVINTLNTLGVTTLLIAHNRREDGEYQPYGNVFWHNLSRMTWFVKKVQEPGAREFEVGLWNRKPNDDAMQRPFGARLRFDEQKDGPVWIERLREPPAAAESDTSAGGLRRQIAEVLRQGRYDPDGIVDILQGEGHRVKKASVERTLRRYRDKEFKQFGAEWGLFTNEGEWWAS